MARARTMTRRRRPQANHRQIRDVMTPDPVCCQASDPAQEAAKIMREKDVGIVPVVDDDQDRKLVGVVTDRYLCLCLIATAREANTAVQDCMTPKTVCCHPEDSVDRAVDLMEENQVRRIPIVDQDNRIRGIVSMADIVRRSKVNDETTHDALEKICEPTGEASKPRAEAGLQYA